MRFPFRRKSLVASPELLETLRERNATLYAPLGGSNINSQVAAVWNLAQSASYAWMYTHSPAVRTVVDLIARNVAQLDLRLFEEIDDEERQPADDHPAALSLEYPSDTQTTDQWVRATVQDKLVFDNAYSLKFRAGDRVILKHIPAHRIQILGQSLFDPDGYRVHRLDGSWVDILDPTDMVHWRGYNPNDPRLGLSPLETLRDVVAEEAALQVAIVELAKSGLAGPSYVYRPPDAPAWSNEARAGFDEWMRNQVKQSARKPFTLEEGMEFRSLGVSPQDAQMLEVRKWALQQVATVFGVPLAKVGLGQGAGADAGAGQTEFYTDTLPPICESLTRQLGLSVLQQEYGVTDYCFEFNLDEKQMGDERLKTLVAATGRPVLVTNEARAMVSKPPVDGGDELVTPLNVIVGENPLPSPAVMPPQSPLGPPQDGSHRTEELPPPSKALVEPPHSQLHPRRKADMQRQRRYVDEASALLDRYYARQARSVKKSLEKYPQKAPAVDSQRWDTELGDDLHKLISNIVEREGGIYVARLGGADFDMRLVQNYVKATAVGIAEALNKVTARDIDELGLEDGLARARNERAAVAAASIGTRSTVFARREAAKQGPTPELRRQTWIADTERHAELDGVSVPLDSDWGGIEPGSEANCACSASVE